MYVRVFFLSFSLFQTSCKVLSFAPFMVSQTTPWTGAREDQEVMKAGMLVAWPLPRALRDWGRVPGPRAGAGGRGTTHISETRT